MSSTGGTGHVGDLSPAQETALTAFRDAVTDIANKPEDNDYYYLRWLRARKFNVDKALDMFRNVCENIQCIAKKPMLYITQATYLQLASCATCTVCMRWYL